MAVISIEQVDGKLTRNGLQALMSLYSDDLFLFVRGIVHNNETAEELVSDVFVKIWNTRDHFGSIRSIKSYLFILARNESISYIRKSKQLKIVSIEEVEEYYFAPLESDGSELFDQEMIDRINGAIELLPVKCKMAFSLAKVNGLKYKEIAEIMGISPLTVKNHIAYALEKICSEVGVSRKGSSITRADVFFFLFSFFKK
jgi:RNA polymerase sigma-70 factor (ECF subfamily)